MRGEAPDEGFQEFLNRAARHPILTAQEERDLSRRAKAGDARARERMVECNLRLVLSIAQRFRGRGLQPADLVQEGIVGLHIAADKFDPDLGFKFSTYATWWVRKAIQRGLAQAGAETIRVPPGVRQRRAKARQLMRQHPDWPLERVAEKMEEPVDLVREALDAAEVVASMNAEAWHGEGGEPLGERLADPHAEDPHESASDPVDPRLAGAVASLPELERRVIELRFGMDGAPARSVGEIAEEIGKPPHAVQAAQRRALASLRRELVEK